MNADAFIAIDWGTTNRRIFRIENGVAQAFERDAKGILAISSGGFEKEICLIRDRHGKLPLVLAGMIGSNRGWIDAGYIPCPADIEALAAAAVFPERDIAVIPGVSVTHGSRGDVMRGEEVQLLGAFAAGWVPGSAFLCQPGTHSKWATIERGALRDFTTSMTGEMFGLLKSHALIGSEMQGDVDDDPAFQAGVAASADKDLLAELFGVRAAAILGLRAPREGASYVSGLLIGGDCRARLPLPGQTVHLLADSLFARLYSRAIDMVGGKAIPVDSEKAFVAGISEIRKNMK
ncbi:2-dehydro-3-deoxygalactonokinase [Novosphingobium naphthalenivorans]|uniref:2-dehydro-3-deoxygalactonokinase n=1 Tax=Novosphingobium naphthalenivorans TaxID=273168 RepID=UPI00083209A7|nr:2-dehydro-3-deoxygalactonokinase [Novosphingobium naphthalenivorans]